MSVKCPELTLLCFNCVITMFEFYYDVRLPKILAKKFTMFGSFTSTNNLQNTKNTYKTNNGKV